MLDDLKKRYEDAFGEFPSRETILDTTKYVTPDSQEQDAIAASATAAAGTAR
jgi:hypothetical protein